MRWVWYSMPAKDSRHLKAALKAAYRLAKGKLRERLKRALEIISE